jgi:hypothetical protein
MQLINTDISALAKSIIWQIVQVLKYHGKRKEMSANTN